MSEEIRSYWFTFKRTGVYAIDRILEEIALAGKCYHNIDGWAERDWAERDKDLNEGKSHIDLIQEAADNAALEIKNLNGAIDGAIEAISDGDLKEAIKWLEEQSK